MNPTLRDTLPHKETPFLRILHILVAVLVLARLSILISPKVKPSTNQAERNRHLDPCYLRIWFNFFVGLP